MHESGQITRLLQRARHGEQRAADELMPLIYEELRRLAKHYMRGERPGHTLQATALVHEAYLRLVGGENEPWQSRAHFFAAAAIVVRRILVQHARAAGAAKRGGGWSRADIDMNSVTADNGDAQILAVDEALQKLDALDHRKARLVELRFFTGMSVDEAAEALGVSPRTAAREWDMAKAWLSRELTDAGDDER
jgi:RNA polymerase sigma factor (TIGR02999 family)